MEAELGGSSDAREGMASNEAGMAAHVEQRDVELSGALARQAQSIQDTGSSCNADAAHYQEDAEQRQLELPGGMAKVFAAASRQATS